MIFKNIFVVYLLLFSDEFGFTQQPYMSAPFEEKVSSTMFRVSGVKINITPKSPQWLLGYGPRKSSGVHDSIYHRIVAMDDGANQFILESSDICVLSPAEYDRIAAKLEDRYSVGSINFWWTVTHTHSAPELGPPGLPPFSWATDINMRLIPIIQHE
jgi:neutral ceramidase